MNIRGWKDLVTWRVKIKKSKVRGDWKKGSLGQRGVRFMIWLLLSLCSRQDMMSHIPPGLSVLSLSLQCALKVTPSISTT